MLIDGKDVALKITPRAIEKIESIDKSFDILNLLRNAKEVEPRASDYYKLIYAGYIGATKEEINYEEFLEKIEEKDLPEITRIGVDLLYTRKN